MLLAIKCAGKGCEIVEKVSSGCQLWGRVMLGDAVMELGPLMSMG